jgi:hypothetical protein
VDPFGDLHAVPERGTFTGNRGCLVDGRGELVRHHRGSLWITCVTRFRGRWVGLARPNRWTPVFFLDDAVALAAGHRPCAECRNADYRSFLALAGAANAGDLDERLHPERGRPHRAELDGVPDGAFVLLDREPWTVLGPDLLRWTPGGYSERRPRWNGRTEMITPPTSLRVLASGWRGALPFIHPDRPS